MDTSQHNIAARVRGWAGSLGPLDYAVTVALVAIYVIGTSMDEGPDTSLDYYRAVATVIPTLLITVAIQGRIFELSRKPTFRHQYRTVLFAIVVFGGEAGTLMTIAREKTNWAAHLYVYMAVLALGLAMVYLALRGTEESEPLEREGPGDAGTQPFRESG
jgi:peptidoglycan/LPS O-acetylase OafA/YrhL